MSELVKVKLLEWKSVADWFEAIDPVFGGSWQIVTFDGRSKAVCRFGRDRLEEIGLDCDAEAMKLTVENLRTARIISALDLTAVDALQAENARLRSLIGRYINHVGELEGTHFLPGPFGFSELLTDAEIAELSAMQKEAAE